MKKLIIHSQDSLRFVSHNDIHYCKSDNCYTTVFLKDAEELVMCKSLKKVYVELDPAVFIRINQSYVVNKHFISIIDKKNKLVELVGGRRIPFTTTISDLVEMMTSKVMVIVLTFSYLPFVSQMCDEVISKI